MAQHNNQRGFSNSAQLNWVGGFNQKILRTKVNGMRFYKSFFLRAKDKNGRISNGIFAKKGKHTDLIIKDSLNS